MEIKWMIKKVHNERVLLHSEYKNTKKETCWYPIALMHIDEFWAAGDSPDRDLFDAIDKDEEVIVTVKFTIEEK